MSCPVYSGGNVFGPCGSPAQARWIVAGCEGFPNWPPNGTYATALAFVNAFDMTTLEWGQVYNLGYGVLGHSNHSITNAPPIYALTQGGDTQTSINSSANVPYSAWSRVSYQEQTGFERDDGSQYINIIRCQLNITSTEIYALGNWTTWIQGVSPDYFGGLLTLTMPPPGNPAPDSCSNGDVTSPPTIVDVPVPSSASSPITGTDGLYTIFSILWEGGTCSDPP